MGRPRTPLESWGEIRTKTKGKKFVAEVYYRASDGSRRRLMRTGSTETAAMQALKAALTEIFRDETAIEGTSTVAELALEWWEEYLAKEPPHGTIIRYRGVLNNHVLPALGELSVREARTPRLDRFLKALTTSKGASTAAVARVLLLGIFGMAQRYGLTQANAADGTATVRINKKEPRAWTIQEVQEIRKQLAARDERVGKRSDVLAPSDFMLGTGCRPGETFALRWDDIDFGVTPPTIRIHATVVKNSETFQLEVQEHTKTRHVRTLALPAFLSGLLLERRTAALSEFVFPSSRLTVRNPDNFRVQWKDAFENTPMFDEMPKAFRSSVASFLAADDPYRAQSQLGHTSIKTTERHYITPGVEAVDNTALMERLRGL